MRERNKWITHEWQKRVSNKLHCKKVLMTNRKYTDKKTDYKTLRPNILYQSSGHKTKNCMRFPQRARTRKFIKLNVICGKQIKPVAKSVK